MPVGLVNGGGRVAGRRPGDAAEKAPAERAGRDLFLRKTDRRFHQALVPAMSVAREEAQAGVNGRIDPIVVSFLDPRPQDRRGLLPHEHVRLLDQLGEAAGLIGAEDAGDHQGDQLRTRLVDFFSREKEMFQSFQWSRMAVLPC